MAETYTLTYPDGRTATLTGIDHDDWNSLNEPCPNCNGTEFDHYRTQGEQLGHRNETPITRTDYEAAIVPLATRCRTCKTVLFKHPLVDDIEQIPIDND